MKGQNRPQKRTKNFTVDFTGDLRLYPASKNKPDIHHEENGADDGGPDGEGEPRML